MLKKLISQFNNKATLSIFFRVAFSAIILVSVVFIFSAQKEIVITTDFLSFYTGSSLIREGKGELLYDLNTQTNFQKTFLDEFSLKGTLPFRTIPFVGVLLFPFSLIGLYSSYKAFALVNLLLLFAFTYLSGKLIPQIKKYEFWYVLPFVFISSISVFILGQISYISLLLVLAIYHSLKTKKSLWAGIFSGFLLLKPQFIVALPFFLILSKKPFSFIKGVIVTGSTIAFISLLFSGFNSLLSYLFLSLNSLEQLFPLNV